jgi:hypothetical protein
MEPIQPRDERFNWNGRRYRRRRESRIYRRCNGLNRRLRCAPELAELAGRVQLARKVEERVRFVGMRLRHGGLQDLPTCANHVPAK